MERWDVIVTGAGPAGMAAALRTARLGLRTLIIEERVPGGLASEIPLLHHFPGGGGELTGNDIVQSMVALCSETGVVINELERVASMSLQGAVKIVTTDQGTYEASGVIIASGTGHGSTGITGEETFRGRGVSCCAVCDGFFFRGRTVLVEGMGMRGIAAGSYLAGTAGKVYLVYEPDDVPSPGLSEEILSLENLEIIENSDLKEIRGDSRVTAVLLQDRKSGERREIEVDGVFMQGRRTPNTAMVRDAGVAVDDAGYIIIDPGRGTSIRGVFAAGDIVAAGVKGVLPAIGQGIEAAANMKTYLHRPAPGGV